MNKSRVFVGLLQSVMVGLFAVMLAAATAQAGSFTAGNIVVYRVGNGSGSLVQTGNPVFIDEYTPSGTFVQSVSLPTTVSGSNKPLVAQGGTGNGSAVEGLITNSSDGQYVVLTGYDTTLPGPGTLSSQDCTGGSAVPRTVGLVRYDGTVDTSTALTDLACKSNVRSATSSDGTNIWASGNQGNSGTGGVKYTTVGSTTSTQLNSTDTNMRQVLIFGGQLYAAPNGGAVSMIGSGLPTTAGQTDTALSLSGAGTSPDGFFMTTVSGGTVLYLMDDTQGTIRKYSLVSGTWTGNGSITYANARAVFGLVSGSTVTLYVRTSTNDAVISTLTDTGGFNGTITGTVTTLITAPANEVFRGIAGAPVIAPTPTETPTNTETPTDTPAPTDTATALPTDTATPLPTDTATQVPTSTSTPLPTSTATHVPTSTATSVPTSTATTVPTNTASPVPTNTATLAPTNTGTPTSTPTATPEDFGFIPPDLNSDRCEDTVARHLKALAACIIRCQIRLADSTLRGKMFDEAACEHGTGKPTSCRAAYDRATAALVGLKKPICPLCLGASAQSALADTVTTFVDQNGNTIYCAPLTTNSDRCEDTVSRHISTLTACSTGCQIKQADNARRGTHFDEDACEQGTGKPVSCRAAYDKATATLLGLKKPICPLCLGGAAQTALADSVMSFIDQINGQIYCAGTTPLPEP